MYLQIEFETMDGDLMDATDEQLGTWVRVCKYCFGVKNGGRIVAFAALDEIQVMRRTGSTLDNIKQAHPYLQMDGDDLVVVGYPLDREDELRRKSAGGKRSQQNKSQPQESSKDSCQESSQESSKDSDQHSTDRKIKRERLRERDDDSLSFLAELFIGCHPACSAVDPDNVVNIMRGEDPKRIASAIEDFSKQWAGAEFPRTSPPLKEFSKYLRFAAKKKGALSGEAVAVAEGPVAFKGRSADDEPPAPRSLTRGSKP